MNHKTILMCSYVPEAFNKILNQLSNIDTIHLYIDLKNASTGLFVPQIAEDLVYNSTTNKKGIVDSSIFQSLLFTINNWKYWCKQRDLKLKIFITNDKGKSQYHLSLDKEYKSNRSISNTTLANINEQLDIIKQKNWEMSESFCNSLDNVYFFNLNFLESDFLSYYLITRKFKEHDNIYHIIASTDKDHYQTLLQPNTIMFYRRNSIPTFMNKNNFIKKFIKFDSLKDDKEKNKWNEIIKNVDPNYIVSIMSIIGDTVDNIKGVKGIGNKTAIKLFSEKYIIDKLFGDYNNIDDRIINGDELILQDQIPINKLSNKWKECVQNNNIVTNSYKMISYECLCKWLESGNTTFKIDIIKYIDKILNNNKKILTEESKDKANKIILNIPDLQLENFETIY